MTHVLKHIPCARCEDPGDRGGSGSVSIANAPLWRSALCAGLTLVLALVAWPADVPASETSVEQTRYTFSPRFGTRKAELNARDREVLDGIIAEWRGSKDIRLEVVGHSDNVPIAPRNRKEYANNQVLSEARARAVADYVATALGIADGRVTVVGVGDREPIASNATAEGRAKNRRVDVTLWRDVGMPVSVQAPTDPLAGMAVLERARVLIDQRRAGDAFRLLRNVESELIGTGEFDYLYGLAALESNELGEAMFALQRAVELDPNYAAARMELARAHFQAGDLTESRRQFELLASQNPPETARAAIAERLAMINRMQSLMDSRLKYYVKTAGGYDSNANSATSLNNFLGFELSEQSKESASSFAEVGGGVRYIRPFTRSLRLDSRLDLAHRANFEASFIDSTSARFNVGLRDERARHVRSLGVQGYRQHVDGSLNSQGAGLYGQWNYAIDDVRQAGVFARVGTTRYGGDLEVKDVYEYLGGFSGSTRFGDGERGLAGLTALYGLEDPIEDGSRYARDLLGIRAFANWVFNSRLQGGVSASALKASYDEVFFPLEYAEAREDTLLMGRLNAYWQFKPDWVLNPSLAYYRNDSNVPLFEFDRYELMLSVSRLW